MGKTWDRSQREAARQTGPGVVICGSGKIGLTYGEAEARRIAYTTEREGRPRHFTPSRVYLCHLCGSWHLTSRPVR